MKNSWKFEPAVWKSLIAGVVALLAIWGLDVSVLGDKLGQTVDVVAALIPLVTSIVAGIWIRKSVSPVVQVVESVNKNGEVVAGPANDVVTEDVVIRTTSDDFPLEGYDAKHL